MKNILVPIDFNPNSKAVFQYALEIAHRMKGKITLLSMVRGIPIARGDLKAFEQDMETATLLHKSRLASFREENQTDAFAHVKVNEVVKNDFPGEGILSMAKALPADLLVMGIRNKTAWNDFFFGSVAKFVIDRMVCDTLMIPPDYDYLPLENMLYLIHNGLSDLKNLEQLKQWRAAWDANFHAMFVAKKEKTYEELKEDETKLLPLVEDFQKSAVHIFTSDKHFQKRFSEFLKLNDVSLIAMEHNDKLIQKLLHARTEISLPRNLHLPILFLVNKSK